MAKPWTHLGEDFVPVDLDPKVVYGYVYVITNLITKKRYVGKKFFWRKTTKVVKGKKKRVLVESDWKTYYGSNTQLNADVKSLGAENFRREILHICDNKSECAYLETWEIFNRSVLLNDEWYNDWVSCKITRMHLGKYREKLKGK